MSIDQDNANISHKTSKDSKVQAGDLVGARAHHKNLVTKDNVETLEQTSRTGVTLQAEEPSNPKNMYLCGM